MVGGMATFTGVQLMKTGTWNASTGKVTIGREDLKSMVDEAKSGEWPTAYVKLGHTDKRFNDDATGDGQPVYGKVKNLRLEDDGDTLVGDLTDVPDDLAKVLPANYPQRSAEVTWGMKLKDAAGKITHTAKAVLTAIALLGAKPPAVKGLADLTSPAFAGTDPGVVVFADGLAPVTKLTSANDLRDQISQAVGPGAWVFDFDPDQKIAYVRIDPDAGMGIGSDDLMFQIGYTVADDGTVTMDSQRTPVRRVTSYQPVTTQAAEADDEHNAQDVTFARTMIPHHQGAIDMTALAAGRTTTPAVLDLAKAIAAAQSPEIKTMSGWLKAWGATPATGGMRMAEGGASIPGMMTAAQMAALKAAKGATFDRLFLTGMIAHHQGALTIAKPEVSGGKNPGAITLAKSIITSQTAQIADMRKLASDTDPSHTSTAKAADMAPDSTPTQSKGVAGMADLDLTALAEKLGAPADADPQKLIGTAVEKIASLSEDAEAATKLAEEAEKNGKAAELAEAESKVAKLTDRVTELEAAADKARRDGIITAALKAGKITAPASKVFREQLDHDEAAAVSMLDVIPEGAAFATKEAGHQVDMSTLSEAEVDKMLDAAVDDVFGKETH